MRAVGAVGKMAPDPWGRGLRQGAGPEGALRTQRKYSRRRGDVRRRGPVVTAGPGGHGAPVPAAGAGWRLPPGAARGPAAAAALREGPARGGKALPGSGEERRRGPGVEGGPWWRRRVAPGRGKAPRCSEPRASLCCSRPSPARPHHRSEDAAPACSVPALPGGGKRGRWMGEWARWSAALPGLEVAAGSVRENLRAPSAAGELSCRRKARRRPRAAAAPRWYLIES